MSYLLHVQRTVLFVCCFSVFIFTSTLAHAEFKIAVVDVQHLLTKSSAAQDVQTQLETRRDSLQSEFSGYEKKLRDQEKTLIEKRSELSQQDFTQERQGFETKLLETRNLVQDKKIRLEKSVAQATATLRDEILKIVADIAETESYQLVLTRQNIVLVEKSIDITDAVKKRLDKEIPKLKLED